MQKGVVVLIMVAGLALFTHRPLTKAELETVRTRLQLKIEAVGKKIDRLSQQMQTLSKKMEMLDRRLSAVQKHFNIELSPEMPKKTATLDPEQRLSSQALLAGDGL